MTPGGRIQATIDVLHDVLERHEPASDALKAWGKAHRFAGSADRAAIASLVYDVLRRRQSIAARMGDGSPRALALGAAVACGAVTVEALDEICGARHAPASLSMAEREALARPAVSDAYPPWIAGDYPQWLHTSLERVFGGRVSVEMAALAGRAPVDVRVNTLKATREKVVKALARFGAHPTPLSPVGVRTPPSQGVGRAANITREPGYGRGHFEIQDEGSQIAALLTGAGAGMQVADLCAGAGGKTLALAALMNNTGQIHAHDSDATRLKPIYGRLKRAGVHNTQVIAPHEREKLGALEGRMDVVLLDAPCSGTGAWRRRPDAKWRLTERALDQRRAEQTAILDMGARLVKPGGRLCYVTCSLLPQENVDQIAAFLDRNRDFRRMPIAAVWRETMGGEPPMSADGRDDSLLLSPHDHGTDGFFIAILERLAS